MSKHNWKCVFENACVCIDWTLLICYRLSMALQSHLLTLLDTCYCLLPSPYLACQQIDRRHFVPRFVPFISSVRIVSDRSEEEAEEAEEEEEKK